MSKSINCHEIEPAEKRRKGHPSNTQRMQAQGAIHRHHNRQTANATNKMQLQHSTAITIHQPQHPRTTPHTRTRRMPPRQPPQQVPYRDNLSQAGAVKKMREMVKGDGRWFFTVSLKFHQFYFSKNCLISECVQLRHWLGYEHI